MVAHNDPALLKHQRSLNTAPSLLQCGKGVFTGGYGMDQTQKELALHPQVTSESKQEVEIDLLALFYHILDHWKLVAICFVIGAVLMGLYTKLMVVPQYQATAKMYVLSSSDSVVNLSDLQMGTQLASDYKEIFQTHEVTNTVIENLGLPYTYNQLKNMLTLANPTATRIISITITSPDPNEAAAVANEYLKVASQYVADVMITDKPTELSTALVPQSPVSPSLSKNVILGAMVGFILACGFLTVTFMLDDKIKNSDDITRLTGLPVLAEIPVFSITGETNGEKKALPGRNKK